MVLVLNSPLRLTCLVWVVRMSTVNSVAAHLEMCPRQEGSMYFMKFMEMKITTDFHFWIAYLIDSEKKFIHLIVHEIHICDYRGHLLLILLLCSVGLSRLACWLQNLNALIHVKFFMHQDTFKLEQYVIVSFSHSLNNRGVKVLFTKCGKQNT